MQPRRVEPEILDALPANDPSAIASRADLKRVNALMGNARLLARLLATIAPPRHIIEIGCGDGTLALRLAKTLAPRWPSVELTLIDRLPLITQATTAAFASLGWRASPLTGDVFAMLPASSPADAVFCNLFLHHFEAPALRSLLAAMARAAPLVVACEPRRASFPAFASRLLGVIGCNAVTRHDALVSVHAGFTATELTTLWPAPGWQIHERKAGLFSHTFRATNPQ